ncbi:hypothetical protein HDF17_003630 [Granulicella arctica]|uniref:RHS repeat-associated core domain-containing protein n=2 Tax=Granulicella arctica TaxID=940613 RepID=A0A7Y9TIR5_9BACT|nr:hypothetical protein [Granulicella arctica]
MNLGNPQSLNRYSYVMNNPLRFRDPSGLSPCANITANYTINSDGSLTEGAVASAFFSCGFWQDVADVFAGIGSGFADFGHDIAGLFGFGHASFKGSTTPRPSTNGGWNGHYMAGQVFQGPGSGSFVAANTAVKYAAAGTAVAYTGAFAAPQIAAGAESVMFGPSAGRVFWSGGLGAMTAAANYAEESGGMTLEMTPVGQFLTKTEIMSPGVWNWASQSFASGATGSVTTFQGDLLRLGNTWSLYEYPVLEGNNPINYISASGHW